MIQLEDLVMVFQMKERRTPPSTDVEAERKWFKTTVLKEASGEIQIKMKYLRECPPAIANDRGRVIAFPTVLDAGSIFKVIVFKGSDELPLECSAHRFHESRTGGFMHMIAADDWMRIMHLLITPREIANYLGFREGICRRQPKLAREVSEKALVGQFLFGEPDADPAPNFEVGVDALRDQSPDFDMLGCLELFPDRITQDAPDGFFTPPDMVGAGTDYYEIIKEVARLPRTDLAEFKTRFQLTRQRAGEYYNPPFTRMVSSTGVGFVLAPVPEGLEANALNGLMNFVSAHMYEQKLRRCIGAAFVREGKSRFISWALLDQEWRPNPDIDAYLIKNPMPPLRADLVPRYRFEP